MEELALRARIARETREHWVAILGFLPKVRANIEAALESDDERLRADMTRWVHAAVVPPPVQVVEHEQVVELGEGAQGLLGEMNQRLRDLIESARARDPMARLRRGPEALGRGITIEAEKVQDDPGGS